MKTLRLSTERRKVDYGWLKTQYSFSFADYNDENWMNYKTLRVINEDRVAPQTGFELHPHRNMEIITYVINGIIRHTDNMGNEEVIQAGEIQQMSAGTGVYHSEHNPSKDQELHLLQIWLNPKERGIKPHYAKKKVLQNKNELNLLITDKPDENALTINQDAKIYSGIFDQHKELKLPTDNSRAYWFQIIRGNLTVNDTKLSAGDGLGIENEEGLNIQVEPNTEFLLFDLENKE